MQQQFLKKLYQLHASTSRVPSSKAVCKWLDGLLGLLFPELARKRFLSQRAFEHEFATARQKLYDILEILADDLGMSPHSIEYEFMETLPTVHHLIEMDAQAIFAGDPAANSLAEVISCYPGFYAIAVYRLAHEFCKLKVPLIPRVLSEHAHTLTGVDIHPSARIGERFCIDHGTGIVIGETVDIGNDVKIYQGVTLGALSVKKSLAQTKRHPTIGDRVIIYAGSTILGGDTIIGEDTIIGGNTWITDSVPARSKIYYKA